MQIILSSLLSLVFLILSVIHFNWVLGGKWGFENALPTNKEGKRVLQPRKIDSAVVGFGLLAFSAFYLIQSGLITVILPYRIVQLGSWLIPIIFLLRAIGDFNYVGFFKKIKNTNFARCDTKLFSPLCLIIAAFGFALVMLK